MLRRAGRRPAEIIDGVLLIMQFLQQPTRLMLFTGKGGVGKTSLACATAVALADAGHKVLLVSTDPASNLGQVFGIVIGEAAPTEISGVPNLHALNINPETAARAYRDRIIAPARDILPAETIQTMEEQLSGACTTEIAAFDEFTSLLGNEALTASYDHIVFDTAPTGHTLRLLRLPTAWTRFLDSSQSGASCLGPLSGLEKQRRQYASAVEELASRDRTTVVLVSRAQRTTLAEAARTSRELQDLGIVNQRLIINAIMPPSNSGDPVAIALCEREQSSLAALPDSLQSLPLDRVPLQARSLVGLAALRALVAEKADTAIRPPTVQLSPHRKLPPLSQLIDSIEQDRRGLVMVLGKGGVGKTTLAAAIAVELAARGHAVHLTTTDPAAHLSMTVEATVGELTVSRIDPQLERDRYREHVMQTKAQHLDDAGRQLLEEDLRSPCTEEIAVFQAFSRVMQESREKFVIVDTAPTGHTLLLLDATGAYHRDVVRHLKPGDHIVTPLMRLQDPQQTKMLIVTLAETTPVLEAQSLQADLRRAGIEPWAWVVNSSLAAAAPTDPLLLARAAEELTNIERVQRCATQLAVVPWMVQEPAGCKQLRALARSGAEEFMLAKDKHFTLPPAGGSDVRGGARPNPLLASGSTLPEGE